VVSSVCAALLEKAVPESFTAYLRSRPHAKKEGDEVEAAFKKQKPELHTVNAEDRFSQPLRE
jgi:GMP synthase PP-ATPase subunit